MLFKILHLICIVPDGPPVSFKGNATSSTSAYLTWNPPSYEDQNGVIIEYVINVTVQEMREYFQLTSNTSFLEVTSLKPYQTYVCMIAAATSVGLGPFSESVTVDTPQDGKIVSLKTHTQTVNVSIPLNSS